MTDLSSLLYKETLNIPAADWLEQHIYFDSNVSPNAPGNLDLSSQPWAREILDNAMDPRINDIKLVFGSQTGKTTILMLVYLLKTRFEPQPSIIALSTDPLADRLVKRRLIPLLKANEWWGSQLPPENRGQENMILMPGSPTFFTGARTPDKLSSMPASLILCDEVSKWSKGSLKESHPIFLIKERVKSFANHLIVSSSTPSDTSDVFWSEYLHSSQSHYFMPCPHCNEEFEFIWSKDNVVWEEGDTETIRQTAHYVCPFCKGKITDEDKESIMKKGHWVKSKSDHAKGHIGYHLNSMYSPYVRFGDIAVEFIKANASLIKHEALRNFWNSWLALPFEEMTLQTSDEDLRNAVDMNINRGVVPDDCDYIVLGGDPGVNASHWVASAVCSDGTIRVIDWGTLVSFKSSDGHYGYKSLVEDLVWTDRKGEKWGVDIAYIDSGYSTYEIYDECLSGIPGQLNPTKGSTAGGTWGETNVRNMDITLYTYNDYSLKMARHHMIKDKKVRFPSDVDREFMKGLEGQRLIRGKSGKMEWKELKEDHYADCLKLTIFCTWVNPTVLA